MKVLIAAVLLAASTFAHAGICGADEIKIDVLPFAVTEDFTKPVEAIQQGASDRELRVGLVETKLTVNVLGCSATVGYSDAVLYVARELTRNSCAKEHVLTHEREHLAIYQRALTDLEARIRQAAQTMSLFDASAQEVIAVRAAHHAHDNVDEYKENITACRGKVMKLAMHLE